MTRGTVELRLLGPAEARRDGRPLRLRTKKAFALLAYLAAEGRTHRRAELAALLWPDSDDRRARTTLRSALADLRSALGPDQGYLRVDRDVLGIDAAAGLHLDLTGVRAAYDLARTSAGVDRLDGDESGQLVEGLRTGAAAYAGDFLDGFVLDDAPDFEHWTDLERERWRRRLAVVLDRLSELLLQSGDSAESAVVAERWTTHEPYSGAAYGRLMRARYALGDPAGALRVYDRYRALGGDGSNPAGPELAALAARIAAEGTHSSPAPRLPARPAQTSLQGSPEAPGVPLVGRAEEFSVLVEEYEASRAGGTRAVAVTGEAGIGKTRLVEEFLRWATAKGADVLRAAAFEATEGLPYGPLVVSLRDRMDRERAPDDLLDDVWLSELSRLLPELRERYPDLPPPPGDEVSAKARLFEAVTALVVSLAARTPVVLFVDDLQWADAATLDLLRYASRRCAEQRVPVLLVAAARLDTPAVRARFARRRAGFSPEVPLRSLEPGPLSRSDAVRLVRTLAAPDPDDEQESVRLERLGGWLHDETGGQPFFMAETLSALGEQGVLLRGGGVRAAADLAGAVPPGVREAIVARLARLGPDAGLLLAATAVVGRHADFDLLRQVVHLSEDTGLAALEEALATGLLREVADDAYAYAHDTIRDVVYTETGGARRRIYHRRALEALQDRGVAAAELARHALAARADGTAFSYSVAAAEEALAVFAVEDAQAHFDRARTLLEASGPAGEVGRLGTLPERLGLYGGLGRIHEVSREWVEAQDAYEHMLDEALRASDRYAEWCTLLQLASLGVDEGNVTEAEQGGELRRVLRRRSGVHPESSRPGGPSPDRGAPAGFAWSLSTAHARAGDALDLARQLQRQDLVAQSLAALGVLDAYSGRWELALSAAEDGIAISSQIGDRATAAELSGLAARCLVMTGAATEAVRRMRGHPGLSGELGDREIHRADVFSMALALTETGDYEEALAIAHEGLAAARSVGYPPRLLLNLVTLGDIQRTMFHLQEAGEVYREMMGVVFPPEYAALVHAKLCAVAALAGRWEEAHAEALLASRLRDGAPVQSTEPLHRHLEVAALLRGGSEQPAREQLARFGEAVGDNRRLRLAHGRALAVLRRYEGNQAAALTSLDEARRLATELGLPGELWQVETSLGELHGERGQPAEAARCLSRAATIVRRLASQLRDVELRQRFLAAAPVRDLVDAG